MDERNFYDEDPGDQKNYPHLSEVPPTNRIPGPVVATHQEEETAPRRR